jgi:hypothetical protein
MSEPTYQIRIGCTSIKELSFNKIIINKKTHETCNIKINRRTYNNSIHNILQPYNFNFIEEIKILHKTMIKPNGQSFTIKRLEINCEREINENEFLEFKNYMINCGFRSENNTKIELIKLPNEPNKTYTCIFNYKFNEQNIRLPIDSITSNKKKNTSKYSSQSLYRL